MSLESICDHQNVLTHPSSSINDAFSKMLMELDTVLRLIFHLGSNRVPFVSDVASLLDEELVFRVHLNGAAAAGYWCNSGQEA